MPEEQKASLQEVRLYTLAGQAGASTATSIKCDDALTCQEPQVVDDTFDSACVDGLLSGHLHHTRTWPLATAKFSDTFKRKISPAQSSYSDIALEHMKYCKRYTVVLFTCFRILDSVQ